MTDQVLDVQRSEGVAHLTLNRPEKRNALSAELRSRIVTELEAAASDPGIGAVVISGAGTDFCAGFDLDELRAADDPAAVFAAATAYHRNVHTFPKPLIAAVSGSAVAGGLDLALLCDLRLGASDAMLGQPQVRHGIPAAYELLAATVGDPAARELCLTGRVLDADEARQIGLIHHVVEPDRVLDRALALAADIASLPASARTKKTFIEHQPKLFGAD